MHRRLFIHVGPSVGLRPAYIRYLNDPNEETTQSATSDDDSKYSDAECASPVSSKFTSHGVQYELFYL